MNAALEHVKSQWRGTPLIRFGGLLIALIVAFMLLDTLEALHHAQRQDYQTALKKERQIATIAQQDYWNQRAEQARAARVELEGRLWRAETPGLARADLQSWLRQRLHNLKLDALQVRVEKPEQMPELESVWKVRGQLKGSVTTPQWVQLLQQLELNPQLLRIRDLRIRRRGPQLRLELIFTAYYLVAAQGESE